MVSAYRARLGELPWMAPYSNHPDGSPDPGSADSLDHIAER